MRAVIALRLGFFLLANFPLWSHATEPISPAGCAKRYADLWSAKEPVDLDTLNADIRQLGAAHKAVSEELAALKGRGPTGEPIAVKKLTEAQMQFIRKQLNLPHLNSAELVGANARGPFVGAYVNQLTTLLKVLEAEAARRRGAMMLIRNGLQPNPFDVDTLAMILKNVRTPPPLEDKAALKALLDAGRTYRTAAEPHTVLPGYSEELKQAWRLGIRKKCCLHGKCSWCPTAYGRYPVINSERSRAGGIPPEDVYAALPNGDPGDLVLFNNALVSPELRAEIGLVSP